MRCYVLLKTGELVFYFSDAISNYRTKFNNYLGGKLVNYLDIDKHALRFTVDATIDMYDRVESDVKNGLSVPLDDSILKYKKSDTLFLIGSGPSLADIDDDSWSHIGRCDSIGFNYSLFHPFVPTYYLLQPHGVGIMKAVANVKDRYSGVPILYRNSGFGAGTIDWSSEELKYFSKNKIYSIREYPISDTSDIPPMQYYRFMEIQGWLSHGVISRFLPKWRCTLGMLLSLGYQMGYRNIVLCGMDMHSEKNNHYWNDPRFSYLYDNKDIVIPKEQGSYSIFTTNKQIGTSVPEYVVTFAEWAKRRADVKITIFSSKTVLFPRIEVYKSNEL